jgi:hypothetical protein
MASLRSRFAILIALGASLMAPASQAAYFDITSTIYAVGTAAPDLWGDQDYILLPPGITAGNCALDSTSGNRLIVRLPHSKAYAAALAAHAAGREVMISLDDTRRHTNGECILRWIRVLE